MRISFSALFFDRIYRKKMDKVCRKEECNNLKRGEKNMKIYRNIFCVLFPLISLAFLLSKDNEVSCNETDWASKFIEKCAPLLKDIEIHR